MALCRDVAHNGFMADECTDVSNKEQFTMCLRWVDEYLVDHEDLLGLYKVDAIDTGSLIDATNNVLIKRAALSYSQCCGQCYSTMVLLIHLHVRSRNGAAKQKKVVQY